MRLLSAVALVPLAHLAAGYNIPDKVTLYSGWKFAGESLTVATDDKCNKLTGWMYRNIGSIYIPCQAEGGKKIMCTLYSEQDCTKEEITFDQTHSDLFDNGGARENHAVGGFTSSVKCRVINSPADREGFVWSRDIPSTKHKYQCPGDRCGDKFGTDCKSPYNNLYAVWCDDYKKPPTCQYDAVYGEACHDDLMCRTGFCANNVCRPSGENDRCPRDSDCPAGLECRPYAGPDHVDRLCMKKDDPHSQPCPDGKCAYHYKCSLHWQGKNYCEWDPNGACLREGGDCILGKQCCSGSCSLFDGRCR